MEILLFAVLVLAALAVFIATRPSDFRVVRSASISASASAVFAELNDFHRWKAWSPWARMDPAAKNDFEGATSGKGAIFRWEGNAKVGQGNMTLIESRPDELVRITIVFIKPFSGTNTAEFTLQPSGGQTFVTWNMSGKNNFIAKAFGLVVNCDKMIGGQFEQGLSNLKAVVESKSAPSRSNPLSRPG